MINCVHVPVSRDLNPKERELPKRKLSLQKVTDRDHHHRSKDIAQRGIPGKGVHHEFDENPVDGCGDHGTQSVAEKLYAAL